MTSILRMSFTAGPLKGKKINHDLLVPLIMGRTPDTGGLFLPGDKSVSRKHGEFFLDKEKIAYRNLSANSSTRINGKPLEESRILRNGDRLEVGHHALVVHLEGESHEVETGKTKIWQRGQFANPLVRILFFLYGLLMLSTFLYFWLGNSTSRSDWDAAKKLYETTYQIENLSREEKQFRIERADQIAQELFAYEKTQRITEAKAACEELMALDFDHDSPIFQFAANRSAQLK